MSDTEDADDKRHFRLFLWLLLAEAILAIVVVAPQSPAMPWWLPALMALTPPGWILPWAGANLMTRENSRSAPGTPTPREVPTPEDYSRLPSDWRAELERWGVDVGRLYAALDRRYAAAEGVSPSARNVFRAFHLTPFAEVRVVLIGQDPYPRRRLADGLAFSQPGAVALDSSLARIFDNLAADPAVDFERPVEGDLTAWARRGVLLLNIALTITDGVAGSDLPLWREFSRTVLRAVKARHPNIVFAAFGRPAADLLNAAGAYSHHTVAIAHPAARDLSHSDLRRFTDSKPFSVINAVLRQKGEPPVDWRL